MKKIYTLILGIIFLLGNSLIALAVETRTVDIEMVSLDLTSTEPEKKEPSATSVKTTDKASPKLQEASVSGEQGGTEDLNIGVGELQDAQVDDKHKGEIDVLSAGATEGESASSGGTRTVQTEILSMDLHSTSGDEIMVLLRPAPDATGDDNGEVVRMDKSDLIERIQNDSEGGLRAAFIKIGDIKGESTDGDADDGLDLDDDSDGASAAKTSKPKEIVVVGSKVRSDNVPQLFSPTTEGEERTTPDSFFDIWVDAADSGETAQADSFFDVFVEVTDEDLQLQVVSIAQNDPNIKEINIDEKVEVTYDTKLKLFGILPIKTTRKVSVDTTKIGEDRVKIKFPWWHVLATKDRNTDELIGELEKALDEDIPQADDRPTEEVAFYYNKLSAQTLQTISNVSK